MKKHSEFIGGEPKIEEVDEEKEKEEKNMKKAKEVSHEWEQINKNTPLWMRKSEDVSNEEYASFYKGVMPPSRLLVRRSGCSSGNALEGTVVCTREACAGSNLALVRVLGESADGRRNRSPSRDGRALLLAACLRHLACPLARARLSDAHWPLFSV